MKTILLLLSFLAFCLGLSAQEDSIMSALAAANSHSTYQETLVKKTTLSDSLIRALTQANPHLTLKQYYEKTPFIEVTMSEKRGFTHPKTQLIYDDIGKYKGNFIAAKRGNVWGLIDSTGKEVGNWTYDEIRLDEQTEQAWETLIQGKKGRIAYDGKLLFLPEYDNISRYNTTYIVEKDHKNGIIDTNGKVILPLLYDYIFEQENETVLLIKDSLCGLMQVPTGKMIFPIAYDYMYTISGGFIIKQAKKAGFADETGKIIIAPTYQLMETTGSYLLVSDSSFKRLKLSKLDPYNSEKKEKNNNMTTCSQDSEKVYIYGMLDMAGNKIFDSEYEEIISWGKDIFCVTQKGKKGFIDLAKKVIIPIEYDDIQEMPYKWFLARKGKSLSIQTLEGKIINQNFERALTIYNGNASYVWLYKKGMLYLLDSLGKITYNYAIDSIEFFNDEYNFYGALDTYLTLSIQGESHFFAPNGKEIGSPTQAPILSNWRSFNLIEERIEKRKNLIYNYIILDREAQKIGKIRGIDNIETYHNSDDLEKGILPISKKNGLRWGYINLKTGKMITGFSYIDAGAFKEGLAKVTSVKGRHFYIDTLGKEVKTIPKRTHFPFEEAPHLGYVGLLDTTGRLILPMEYDLIRVYKNYGVAQKGTIKYFYDFEGKRLLENYKVLSYYDSLFIVENKAQKVGMVNRNEQLIFPFQYENIREVGEKYAAQQGRKWALLSPTGKILTQYAYTDIEAFSENSYWVKRHRTWQLIDSLGHLLNPLSFSERSLNYLYAVQAVKYRGKWAVIRNDGALLSSFQKSKYDEIERAWGQPFQEVEDALIVKEKEGYCYITDRDKYDDFWENRLFEGGKISQKYDSIPVFENYNRGFDNLFLGDYAQVGKKGLWGLADRNGIEKVPPIYAEVTELYNYNKKSDNCFALTKTNGKKVLYFPSQSKVLPTEYTDIQDFNEGLAIFSQDKQHFGYVDTLGNTVIPAQYNFAESFVQGMAVVQIAEQTGLIDKAGKWLIPPQYEAMKILGKERVCVKNNCKFTLYDTHNQVLSKEYDMISKFRDKDYIVLQGEKTGIIDSMGREIVPCLFEAINSGDYPPQLFCVAKSRYGLNGIWDAKQQKLLIPCEYDAILWLGTKGEKAYFVAKKREAAGVLDSENKTIIPFDYTMTYEGFFVSKGLSYHFEPACLCLKEELYLDSYQFEGAYEWE